MIVVDSGVWIDYFNGVANDTTDELDRMLGTQHLAVGELILAEVLQGIRSNAQYQALKQHMLELTVVEMLGTAAALRSVEHYRALRKLGITVRKTIDVFIASYCIEHRCPLLFQDKDYEPFVQHLGLIRA